MKSEKQTTLKHFAPCFIIAFFEVLIKYILEYLKLRLLLFHLHRGLILQVKLPINYQ